MKHGDGRTRYPGQLQVLRERVIEALLTAWSKLYEGNPCLHRYRVAASDIPIFIKDGHLAQNKDGMYKVERVVYCSNKTCEKVFEVTRNGVTTRSEASRKGPKPSKRRVATAA